MGVEDVRLRWSGHRLAVQARLVLAPGITVAAADQTAAAAEHAVRHALPAVGTVDLTVTATANVPIAGT